MNDWDRIIDLESQLDAVVIGLLSRRGWRHTSSTPDSVWRWTKVIDGTTYMTDQRGALSIERSLQDMP